MSSSFKTFGHENPLFSQPTFEVTIDVWENQRYKPLQGGWQGPYNNETMPAFSNLDGEICVPFDRNTNTPIITLPLGWQWCSDSWKVDKSNAFGLTDVDGWSYASTFETLIENSVKKKLEGEMGRMSLVRRRRWVRKHSSVTTDAKKAFESRLNWVKDIRKRMEKIAAQKSADYSLVSDYEFKRRATFDRILFAAETVFNNTARNLEGIVEKLQLMKQFLIERGNLERDYAKKMTTLSSKWMNAGTDVGSTVVVKKNPGFFFAVSSASKEVASRLDEFSGMLIDSLPSDVDSVISEIQSLRQDSLKEGPKLRQILKAKEELLSKSLSSYRTVLELTQARDEHKRAEMLESLYCISAAECLPSEESANHMADSEVNAINSSASNTPAQTKVGQMSDVWLTMQKYKKAIVEADSALFIFNAFADQLRKQSQLAGSRVSALLHSLIKVFAGEQVRVWQDASLLLRKLAPSPTSRRPSITAITVPTENVASITTGVVLSVTKEEPPSTSDGEIEVVSEEAVEEVVEEEEVPVLPVLPDVVPAVKIGYLYYLQVSKQGMQDLMNASANSLQLQVSTDGGRQNFISRSASFASNTGNVKEDSFSWKEAVCIITNDHFLHLFKCDRSPLTIYSEYASNNCWINDDPVLSVDIAGVEVEPILFVVSGQKDVFEVKAKQPSKVTQSRRPSATTNAKTTFNAAIVGHLLLSCSGSQTDDEYHEWMRLICNPLSDPSIAAPETTSKTALNASDIHKQKAALLASFVQPLPSVNGTEI